MDMKKLVQVFKGTKKEFEKWLEEQKQESK